MTYNVSSGTLNLTHLNCPHPRKIVLGLENLSWLNITTPGPAVGGSGNTVKPFNLAALKVGDFACKIILAPFILTN